MEIPFRKDDQDAVMAALNPMVPVLLREGLDDGFHSFKLSRALDPDGFAEYGPSSRANMLYDRVAASCRDLIGLAASAVPALSWQIHENKKSTEILFDPYFAFRMKRVKQNRGGRSTGVNTSRRRSIMSDDILPVGQMVLDFGNSPGLPDINRLWLTLAFDLDELEENLCRVALGAEGRKRFLWKRPLEEGDSDIVASFPSAVADRINEMRTRRTA